jgi:hypothetical protein
MTQYGTWVSYGGEARIWLAIGLLAAAGGAAVAGIRLSLPVRFTRPGPAGRIAMIVAWAVSIAAFLVGLTIYVRQYIHAYDPSAPAPKDPIAPITLTAAAVVFVIIIARRSPGFGTRLASGAIGAIAAPMIFEFPFDLIVMTRTYPPIPPDPALYRALFFVPLFLISPAPAEIADDRLLTGQAARSRLPPLGDLPGALLGGAICIFKAESAADVAAVNEQAGLPTTDIVEAIELRAAT